MKPYLAFPPHVFIVLEISGHETRVRSVHSFRHEAVYHAQHLQVTHLWERGEKHFTQPSSTFHVISKKVLKNIDAIPF